MDGIKGTGDMAWVALQMWCSGMIGDGCEHVSIAWPGMVSVKRYILHCRQINGALSIIVYITT